MLFNSYIFIFIFLPLTLLGWYGLNKLNHPNFAMAFLTLMSLWFYGYFNPSYLLIIVSSICFNYILSLLFERFKGIKAKKVLFALGIAFNLGILFYYKYYDFFVDNINKAFKTDFALKNILLPLGISFFTFQQLSFIIDRYKGRAKHYGIINYATFVTFFPQLVAGPIVLYDEMMGQFEDLNNRRFNSEKFAKGIWLFVIGLSKKVLLADVLAGFVNGGYNNYYLLDSPSTAMVGLLYAFELYFDFSGYSDMAIGLGRMFGVELPQNFRSPYKSYSVKNLWQNWHITLSRFFMRYVYIPMGGNRKGTPRKLFNVFVVFFLSGVWHGANWTFILWGVIQGLFLVFDNLYIIGAQEEKGPKPLIKLPRFVGTFLTFIVFSLSLYIFRSDNLSVAFTMFKNLFSFKVTGYFPKMFELFDVPEIYIIKEFITIKAPQFLNIFYFVVMLLYTAVCFIVICGKNALQIIDESEITIKKFVFAGILFVWSVVSFSQVSTFIYFNF